MDYSKCLVHGGEPPMLRDKCAERQATPCLRSRFGSLKAKLTKAQRAKDWAGVLKVTDEFDELSRATAYPDWWHLFERAREDAEYEQRRANW
jgi:hypothetical protein